MGAAERSSIMRLLCCVAFALLALGCAAGNAEVHAVVEEEMAMPAGQGPVGSEPSAAVVPEEEEVQEVQVEDAKPKKKKGAARTSKAPWRGGNPNQDPPWNQNAPWEAKGKASPKKTKKKPAAKKAKKKKKAPAKKKPKKKAAVPSTLTQVGWLAKRRAVWKSTSPH